MSEDCGLPQAERRGDWMQTFTGRQYWPLDPRADDVDPIDIQHHLSMICRYCGACNRFYSVAEHSLGVLYVGSQEAIRRGWSDRTKHIERHLLLHDAAEAFCHDLIRPIKRSIQGYTEIEALNFDAIAHRFNLDGLLPDEMKLVKDADNAMLLAEQSMLMKPAPARWAHIEVPAVMVENAVWWIYQQGGTGLHPAQAEHRFRDEMNALKLV